MFKKLKYAFTGILITSQLISGNLDSLRLKLSKTKNDSAKVELLYEALMHKSNLQRLNDSLVNEILAFENNSDCQVGYQTHLYVGNFYLTMKLSQQALEQYMQALKIADKCKDAYGLMRIRYQLGYLDKITDHIPAAKVNLHHSRYYADLLKDSVVLANNYTILGNIYKNELILDSALNYHLMTLKIRELRSDKRGLAQTYNNLGLVYKNLKDYDKALYFMQKAIDLKTKTKDKSLSSSYNNIGIIYLRMRQYDKAVLAGRKGLEISLKMKRADSFLSCAELLAETYDSTRNQKMALYYYKRIKSISDSVKKDEISSQFQELQSKYESDKKDNDLRLKGESLRTAEALNSRKNILILLSSLALLMAVIASVFIFRSYKQSKKNTTQLEQKNKIIEEKNKEITDSINYAKNIQQSLITSEKVFSANLKDHFILYLPKDIVSGDFYWAQTIGKEFIIVCADCTGHGVPGAFMSLMAIGYLKEIVNQKQIVKPDIILNELRAHVIEGFSLSSNKDGMDASLIKLNGLQLQVSAANNPIWIIRNSENMVIRPDKFPIGNHFGDRQPFTLNTIELKENDLVLMYTDGYADQFGGPNNKKHKNKAIEKLIIDNAHLPFDKLKKLLHDNLKNWQGNYEQVDDILVIGFRV